MGGAIRVRPSVIARAADAACPSRRGNGGRGRDGSNPFGLRSRRRSL